MGTLSAVVRDLHLIPLSRNLCSPSLGEDLGLDVDVVMVVVVVIVTVAVAVVAVVVAVVVVAVAAAAVEVLWEDFSREEALGSSL